MEEVIHNSRLYSILVRERVSGEKLGEDEDGAALAPWSTTGLISDIRSVRRTLSRKFSSLRHRRKRKKEDGGSQQQQQQQDTNYCDNEPSAITGDTSAAHSSKVRSSDGSRIKRHTKHHDSSNCYTTGSEDESAAEEDTATNCYGGTGGKSLSRIFGSFRHSFRHGKSDDRAGSGKPGCKDPANDTGKAADQSHEEILSGRDSAYFSLTFTSASESENEDSSHNHNNRICDESRDSIKSASLPPAPARKHQSCQTEPKKNVTLVLPDTRSPGHPYGLHLQTRTVRIRAPRHEHRLEPAGDTSWQLETIVHVAKVHLVSSFPRFRVSIDIIFSPSMKCFMSLSSSTIGKTEIISQDLCLNPSRLKRTLPLKGFHGMAAGCNSFENPSYPDKYQ